MGRFFSFLFAFSFLFLTQLISAEDLVVRVGLSTSATGVSASPSTNGRHGIEAMVEWVNEGNVCVRHNACVKIELIHKGDDQSVPNNALQFYRELIADQSIDFLIGPYGTTATALVQPESETAGKLLLAPFAATDSLFEEPSKWRVQVGPPASTYLQTLIGLLENTDTANHPISVALPSENDEFAKSVNGFTRSEMEDAAHVFSILFDSGQTACSAIPAADQPCYYPVSGGSAGSLEAWVEDQWIVNTPASLNDVAVLSSGHNSDGIRLTKKLRDLGLNPNVLAVTISPGSNSFFAEVGPYARGIVGNTAWHEPQEIYSKQNASGGFHFFGPAHGECSQRIRALNGNTVPSYHAGTGGMAILVLARAIQKAGGIDSMERIANKLHELKVQTCFGQYQVDKETGYQKAGRMLMVQWHTPEDDPALLAPTLRVVAAPSKLKGAHLAPFVYPKP